MELHYIKLHKKEYMLPLLEVEARSDTYIHVHIHITYLFIYVCVYIHVHVHVDHNIFMVIARRNCL